MLGTHHENAADVISRLETMEDLAANIRRDLRSLRFVCAEPRVALRLPDCFTDEMVDKSSDEQLTYLERQIRASLHMLANQAAYLKDYPAPLISEVQ